MGDAGRPARRGRRPTVGPVATFYGPADAAWAACLMLELRARGVEVWDHADPPGGRAAIARQAGALLVVRSWFGSPSMPTEAEVAAVGERGPYVVARRNWTKLSIDDHPGGSAVVTLWDDYYQPIRSSAGRGTGGFAHLLDLFLGHAPVLDLPPGYVFISYRQIADRAFVQGQLRPCLARAGVTSWDYRASERAADLGIEKRLEELVRGASALLVVATSQWYSPWTNDELELARRHRVPVLGVRPPAPRSILPVRLGGRTYVLRPGQQTAPLLVAALRKEGVRPFGEA